MTPNNNLSVLPWYTSIEQQNARKWWVYGRVYPLFTPATYMLPFQIMRNHSIVGGGQSFSQEYYFQKTDSRLVRDKAQVTRLLGRTWVWNQLLKTYKNNDYYTIVNDYTISFNFQGESQFYDRISERLTTVLGHIYYLYIKESGNSVLKTVAKGDIGVYQSTDLANGISTLITGTGVETFVYVTNGSNTNGSGTISFAFVDLTLLYGEGNEPTTVAEFEALFPNILYPHNAHKFLNNSASGIKTNGFNQWDEEWENGQFNQTTGLPQEGTEVRTKNKIGVLPNTTYFYRSSSVAGSVVLFFYDHNDNYLEYLIVSRNNTFTTPSQCYYIRFYEGRSYGTTYNNDITLNISDNSRNGEYEPYHERTMDLPITTATGKLNGKGESILLFPNGLCGIDDDRDEMDNTTAIRRLGTRAYQEGDENDSSVRTDGTNTIYVLSAPEHYVLDEEYAMLFDANRYGTQLALPVQTEEPTMTPLYSEVAPYQLISLFRIFKANGEEVGDFTSQFEEQLRIKTFDALGYDVIINQGNFPFISAFPNGQYYALLNDGKQTWYSEVFTAVNDIEPYLKIEWWDTEDFVMDAGAIVYKNPAFRNVLYLDSDLAKPEYPFEEEGETRDGYFFPIKQISEKHYRFKFFASEYLLDVMRFIRMADYARITYHGQTYALDTFLITPEWEDNGDVASVEAEFDTATVAKKIGRGYIAPTADGNFNDDFNNDFNN